ncbi:MAG: magnesium transporter CorA family protein [bacterium]|nr:magnesium transporter CorA family protein [bacterium]
MRIEAMKLEGDRAVSLNILKTEDVVSLVRAEAFCWIDIEISRANRELMNDLLVTKLDFHPATVDDCFQPTAYHQPKLDEEQNYRFITFLYFDQRGADEVTLRELNIYVGETFVITIHRHAMPEYLAKFKKLPRHITEYKERAILFLHHVLHVITEGFTPILRQIQRSSDELEISILRSRGQRTVSLNPFKREEHLTDMRRILRSRQALVVLRRTIFGEREIIGELINEFDYEDAPESSEEIAIYFRDIADHMGKFLEILESEDRSLNHVMEMHHLVSNYRTNEIVIVLTIISVIMLPLNLVVGFFGMNFENMRIGGYFEHPGSWGVLGSLALITVGLFVYFRAKEWI